MVGNWCIFVKICPMGNARGGWKLVTFNIDLWPWKLFSYFIQFRLYILNGLTWQLHFQFGDTSSEYLHHGWVSRSWVQRQGHGSEKAVACNSKTTGWKLLRLDRISVTITLEVSRRLWHFDHETYFRIFSIQALGFECLNQLHSVWKYIFRISRPTSSFKVMRVNLQVMVAKQRSSVQVCAPQVHRLILALQ